MSDQHTYDEIRNGRLLYAERTSNDPTIHCNRFATWNELTQRQRDQFIEEAKTINGPHIDLKNVAYDAIIETYREEYPDLPEQYTANDIVADVQAMIRNRRALDSFTPTIDYMLEIAQEAGYKDSGHMLQDAQNQLMLCRFATKIIDIARELDTRFGSNHD